MKLVRFGAAGAERPGIIDAAGGIRDVSAHVPDFAGEWLSRAGRERIAALDLSRCPLVEGPVTWWNWASKSSAPSATG